MLSHTSTLYQSIGQVPIIPLLIQLLANELHAGISAWVFATHVRDVEGVPGSGLAWPGLAVAGASGMNHQMKDSL